MAETDETTTKDTTTNDDTKAEKTAPLGETKNVESGPTTVSNEASTEKNEKRPAAANDESTDETTKSAAPPKKAKIAMPPAVSDSLVNVDKYELDAPLAEADQPSDEETKQKITAPCLILFGLHPLIREAPLKKMCEDFGTVVNLTVRSAFANRYGHVEFETVEEAQRCYQSLNGAKLLHKAILVQPGKVEAKKSPPAEEENTAEECGTDSEDSDTSD